MLHQDPDFLRYLSDADLAIGVTGLVEQANEAAGLVVLRRGERSVAMGRAAAEQLLVVLVDDVKP